MERWKNIKQYGENYKISNLGRVASWVKGKQKILKASLHSRNGYMYFSVWYKGKYRSNSVHRCVAEAFVLNLKHKPQVNHKDGDRLNNKSINLEWVTPRENIAHAVKMGSFVSRNATVCFKTSGEKNGNSKLNWEMVDRIRELYGCKKMTRMELSKKYKITYRAIWLVVNKRTWKERYRPVDRK